MMQVVDMLPVAQGLLTQMFHTDFIAALVLWDIMLSSTDGIISLSQLQAVSLY